MEQLIARNLSGKGKERKKERKHKLCVRCMCMSSQKVQRELFYKESCSKENCGFATLSISKG